MFRFIFNFIFFGVLFYLIWYFFPDTFNTLVTWTGEAITAVTEWIKVLIAKFQGSSTVAPH